MGFRRFGASLFQAQRGEGIGLLLRLSLNCGGENLMESEARMGNNGEKLRIAMFGDGDIIGTTKKKCAISRLLAA